MKRVSVTFCGLATALFAGAAFFACQGGTSLSGSSGSRHGGSSRDDGHKQAAEAQRDGDARVETDLSAGVEVETGEVTAEVTRSATSTSLSSTATAMVDDEASDEELRIIPPEVVSGAYLTCAEVSPRDAKAPPGYAYHGCATFDSSGARLSLKGVKKEFLLLDAYGEPLDEHLARVVTLKTHADDVVWQVRRDVLAHGVEGELLLFDEYGIASPVQMSHSAVILNDATVETY